MSVALIADAHLGGAGGPADKMVEQLSALPGEGCDRLILMGDIFNVWVGDRRFETEAIRRVVRSLLELRRQGMRIDYIEGNRDFFLARSPYAEAFTSIGAEVGLETPFGRYLIVHGDGLNDRDRQYLFWRWLSKSWLSRALILNLPSRIARWALERTEAALAKTNFKHRVGVPRAAITSFAEGRLAAGHDVLLLGHFHQQESWRVEGGEVRIVDAWFNSRAIEWLDPPDILPLVSDP